MNNKSIIKEYEDTCTLLKKDKSEEAKQRFLIIFKELDLLLSKDYEQRMSKLEIYEYNIKREFKRIDSVIDFTKMRRENRERMVKDYKKYIGYDPKPRDLKPLECIEVENHYRDYRTNLTNADKLIQKLLESKKNLSVLRKKLETRVKNREVLEKDISKSEREVEKNCENIVKNEEALSALYEYCSKAPFNESNAYYMYILIKTQKVSKNKVPTPIRKRIEK